MGAPAFDGDADLSWYEWECAGHEPFAWALGDEDGGGDDDDDGEGDGSEVQGGWQDIQEGDQSEEAEKCHDEEVEEAVKEDAEECWCEGLTSLAEVPGFDEVARLPRGGSAEEEADHVECGGDAKGGGLESEFAHDGVPAPCFDDDEDGVECEREEERRWGELTELGDDLAQVAGEEKVGQDERADQAG